MTNPFKNNTVTIIIFLSFFINSFAYGLCENAKIPVAELLQVESPFSPMLDLIGQESATQMKIEMALILAMLRRGKTAYTINMELRKAYSIYGSGAGQKKQRLIEVAGFPVKKGKNINIIVKIRHGKARGKMFRIQSSYESIEQIQKRTIVQKELSRIHIERFKPEDRSFEGKEEKMEAPERLYLLKEECYKQRQKVLDNNAASILVAPETGKKCYYKQGIALEPFDGHVFFLEGEKWDIPYGVDFPGYLKAVINTDNGALVITTGDFYENKYKKVIAAVSFDPSIRKLSDKEIYERFGLKRVYDHNGHIFTLPVLSTGGKTLLLPVMYSITTIRKGRGRQIIKKGVRYRDKDKEKHFIFGLEFKNTGTTGYSGHNKAAGEAVPFPPTVFASYIGEKGIFLDWKYNFGEDSPVGLDVFWRSGLPREEALMKKGTGLTRWTLAANKLGGKYAISLRAPVGDYRRLSVFFEKQRQGKPELFRKILEEKGLSPRQYFLKLAENYGKHFRDFVEQGIIQFQHGSLINADIDGKWADVEDFLPLGALSRQQVRKGAREWIYNLVKLINIEGGQNDNFDNILEVFAAHFFHTEAGRISLEKKPDGRINLDALSENISDFIMGKRKKIIQKGQKPGCSKKEFFDQLSQEMNLHFDKPVLSKSAKIRKKIKANRHINEKLLLLLSCLKDNFELKGRQKAVDIVIDLTLIPFSDANENLETWASLILRVAKMENVNFIFEVPHIDREKMLSGELLKERKSAVSQQEALRLIKRELKEKARCAGLEEQLNIDEFFRVRINRGRRKGAIEIPIISKVWLKWQEEIKVIDPGRQVLENNQFPVAMEDISLIKDKGLLLRNFETALTVGLLKARLAMIKKEDTKIDKESLSDIIFRLQGVYDLFADIKTEFEQMTIDERFIDNMVSEYPEVRLGHAIQTALPAITRMFVNELKQYHDLIQFIQCVA